MEVWLLLQTRALGPRTDGLMGWLVRREKLPVQAAFPMQACWWQADSPRQQIASLARFGMRAGNCCSPYEGKATC